MLSLLESLTASDSMEIAQQLAMDFRARRVEKNLTRRDMAARSGVALSNIVRFEQKGLISLNNLISLAISLNYAGEIKNIFAAPKYSTMDELLQIRRNSGKTKAHKKR